MRKNFTVVTHGRPAAAAALVAVVIAAGPATAGPPFVSDDPEPTDLGHWEIYNFVAGTETPGETIGQAGFDLNYGAAKDLQLTAVLPLGYQRTPRAEIGVGGIELAAKYKFLHQSDGSPLPDVAFFPRLITPAVGGRTFGTTRTTLFLPLWGQKDLGKWSVFGGGGYTINPGPGRRDFWLDGIGVTRTLSERLAVGGEVFRQTADAADTRPFTAVNLGALYRLSHHWSLIGAAGPGLENPRAQGQFTFYLALKADY